jgi:hypothetical protein
MFPYLCGKLSHLDDFRHANLMLSCAETMSYIKASQALVTESEAAFLSDA